MSLKAQPVTIIDLLSTNECADIEFKPERLGLTAHTATRWNMSWTLTWCAPSGSDGARQGMNVRPWFDEHVLPAFADRLLPFDLQATHFRLSAGGVVRQCAEAVDGVCQ